jgi:hypothetical protein
MPWGTVHSFSIEDEYYRRFKWPTQTNMKDWFGHTIDSTSKTLYWRILTRIFSQVWCGGTRFWHLAKHFRYVLYILFSADWIRVKYSVYFVNFIRKNSSDIVHWYEYTSITPDSDIWTLMNMQWSFAFYKTRGNILVSRVTISFSETF